MPVDRSDSPHALAPRLEIRSGVGYLQGAWIAAQLADKKRVRALQAALKSTAQNSQLAWDLRGITQLDHLGAQLLLAHWDESQKGAWPQALECSEAQRALLERVAQWRMAPQPAQRRTWRQSFLALGDQVSAALSHGRGLTALIGQLALDVWQLIREPRRAPWRDISGHLYRMGTTALPITALVGFLIGVVLAYLSAQQLRQFGADSFIVDLLGVSLIRELGPMLAAILIAGRSGSAITAQIGVMRVTQELDAMRVMGIAHGFRLVMPRAIALAIVMPLIAVWTTCAALLGGMLAADIALQISPSFFLNALPKAVQVSNLVLALGKSVVFGILIALIGCHWGMRVKPNTESLGEGTTASVVSAITAVILADAVFAIVFKNVGI